MNALLTRSLQPGSIVFRARKRLRPEGDASAAQRAFKPAAHNESYAERTLFF